MTAIFRVIALFIAMGVHSPDYELSRAIAIEAAGDPFAGEMTEAIMVAVATRESGGQPAVTSDDGAYCAFQIQVGRPTDYSRRLLASAAFCASEGARMLSASWDACHYRPPRERLAAYARGTCSSERGQKISTDRYHLATRGKNGTMDLRPRLSWRF